MSELAKVLIGAGVELGPRDEFYCPRCGLEASASDTHCFLNPGGDEALDEGVPVELVHVRWVPTIVEDR